MKLHSYVVTKDTGFAPNPFWGYCTLATCKPNIRRRASVGDWIVGLSSKASGNRVVYAMQVDELLEIGSYFVDDRFRLKQPDRRAKAVVNKCGDNIYAPLSDGGFRQLASPHSDGEHENPREKKRDLSGKRVLIGRRFHYFGGGGPELPPDLHTLKVARGHKCRFPPDVIERFVGFIAQHREGVIGRPTHWPEDDSTWKQVPDCEAGSE